MEKDGGDVEGEKLSRKGHVEWNMGDWESGAHKAHSANWSFTQRRRYMCQYVISSTLTVFFFTNIKFMIYIYILFLIYISPHPPTPNLF